jgi:hypothetical protein
VRGFCDRRRHRGGIRAMIARREKMKAAIDALVKENGESTVFVQ